MTILCFAAFSLVSVPAYVAMFGSEQELDMDDDGDDTKEVVHPDAPFALATSGDWDASPIHRNPISGLFQRSRLKRLM
jgi:hypothetical protein